MTNLSECRQRNRRWGDWVCGYWSVDGIQICGAWELRSWIPPVRGGEERWDSGCVWNEQRSMTQNFENTLMRHEKIKIKSHSFPCSRYILSGHENLSLCSYKYTMFSKTPFCFLKERVLISHIIQSATFCLRRGPLLKYSWYRWMHFIKPIIREVEFKYKWSSK